MAAEVDDVLKVNLVLVGTMLLRTQEQRDAFQQKIGTEIMSSGVLIEKVGNAQEFTGHVLQIPKDRISLECSDFRTAINRDYPRFDEIDRFADVIDYAISCSADNMKPITAFGFNTSLTFDNDSNIPAIRYIADRFFSSRLPSDDDSHLVGGFGKLIFRSNEYQSTFTVEPRRGDTTTTKVFLDINRHFDHGHCPRGEELVQNLESLWTDAHALVNRIEANVFC